MFLILVMGPLWGWFISFLFCFFISHLTVSSDQWDSLEDSVNKLSQASAEMNISWKICLQYVLLIPWMPLTAFFLLLTNRMAFRHFLGKFPLTCLYTGDKETLQVLMRKLSIHQYFSQASFWNFTELFCVTLFDSPTHFGMCCQEVFSPMSSSSNSGNRTWHNTFRQSRHTVWRLETKCKETGKQKKNKKKKHC